MATGIWPPVGRSSSSTAGPSPSSKRAPRSKAEFAADAARPAFLRRHAAGVGTSHQYSAFARLEARGESALYEAWALGIADDEHVLALIDGLPGAKQQPNLVLSASRHVGAPEAPYAQFRDWLLQHWDDVRGVIAVHSTQTNEARRCTALLPLLASLPQPLALLEVGAAAGLCLYPDCWSYQYDGGPVLEPRRRPSAGLLRCATNGRVPVPRNHIDVAWRAGIDLNPLDVRSLEDASWLRALVWPEQIERRAVLDAAMDLAKTDPPLLVAGDLTIALMEVAELAPADATLVVFHTAALTYVEQTRRETFVRDVRQVRGHWIANEAPGVLASELGEAPSRDAEKTLFLLSFDGEPCAYSGPHGQSLEWIRSRG